MRFSRCALLASAMVVSSGLPAFCAPPPAPAPGPAAPGAPAPAAAPAPVLPAIAPLPSSQTVQFDVILPLSNKSALLTLLGQQQNPASPQYHKWLKPNDFANQFGPSPQLMNAVKSGLQQLGLQVVQQSRSVHVTGTAAQVNAAFNIALAIAATPSGQPVVIAGSKLTLPPALTASGVIVTAFSASGFQAGTFIHRMSGGYIHSLSHGYIHSLAHGYGSGAAIPAGYFYNDLKQAYDYPSYQTQVGGHRLDGTGATVAVVMASDVQDSDIATLFANMGFQANAGQPAPHIAARRTVNGGNAFDVSNPAAEEATADVEQVLGGAPGSNVVLYTTPDLSDQSLVSAYTAIVNDNIADVVSMSYGQCELNYTAAYNNGTDQTAVLNTFSELFEQGNAQGITFVAAAGDNGALGCMNTAYYSGGSGQFIPGVSVPAADPNVTAVGGTNLVTAADNGGAASSYVGENAWGDPETPYDPMGLGVLATGGVWGSGGGVSSIYAQPAYQALVPTGSTTARAVPDIAMQMGGCPEVADLPCDGGGTAVNGSGNTDRSSLNIVFNGQLDTVVGTSVAAPEFASVVAMLVEMKGRQGNLNYALYGMANAQSAGGTAYFHNGIGGWNGVEADMSGYSFSTGVGSPDVALLLGLPSAARAGLPQTASNP